MIERVEVEDAANPLPELAIEPALELEREPENICSS